MFGYYGKKAKLLALAVVNQAVGMTFRAVVTLAGRKILLVVIKYTLCLAAEDIDYLAVTFMLMISDARADRQAVEHNLVVTIRKLTGKHTAVAAFKFFEKSLGN